MLLDIRGVVLVDQRMRILQVGLHTQFASIPDDAPEPHVGARTQPPHCFVFT